MRNDELLSVIGIGVLGLGLILGLIVLNLLPELV